MSAEDGRVEIGARVLAPGLARVAPARERMARQAGWFAAHRDDRVVQ